MLSVCLKTRRPRRPRHLSACLFPLNQQHYNNLTLLFISSRAGGNVMFSSNLYLNVSIKWRKVGFIKNIPSRICSPTLLNKIYCPLNWLFASINNFETFTAKKLTSLTLKVVELRKITILNA